jgi:hypothetical protein
VHFVEEAIGVPRNLIGRASESVHQGEVILQKGNDPPGVLCHSQWMQATFHHNSDLTDFPFEKEEMRVTFDLIGSDDRMDVDHGRVLLPINTEVRVLDPNSLHSRVHM